MGLRWPQTPLMGHLTPPPNPICTLPTPGCSMGLMLPQPQAPIPTISPNMEHQSHPHPNPKPAPPFAPLHPRATPGPSPWPAAGVRPTDPGAMALARAIAEEAPEEVTLVGVYAHCGDTYGCRDVAAVQAIARATTAAVIRFVTA